MMKNFLLLLLFLLPAGAPAAQEIRPEAAQAAEAAAVRDRLSSSLFFRGELAGMIIDAGAAERFVDLSGVETHAGARSLLLEWISRYPANAAAAYLELKGGGVIRDSMETRVMSWEFNPAFLAAIKNLHAAAGSSSISREAMEVAARRLYGEAGWEGEGPAVQAGRPGGTAAGSDFFSLNYADYKLNQAGLAREVARAGAWLEAARPGLPELLQEGGPYASAFSLYREFVVEASALKGRASVTARESARVEELRLALRRALAALTLRSRVSALAGPEVALAGLPEEPGACELLAALRALKGELAAGAAQADSGEAGLADLGRLVNAAENKFSAMYLRYTAYDGLLNLRRRAAASTASFSCLYDYVFFSYLAAFFPASPYPAARVELAAGDARLGEALSKAGAGDLAGALSGLDTARLEAAAGTVDASSRLNRAAQFFGSGLLLRPVENRVYAASGRARFKPAFTFFEIMVRRDRR